VGGLGARHLVLAEVYGLAGSLLRPLEAFGRALERGAGVPRDAISTLKTGFSRPFTENAESLVRELRGLRKDAGKPLIVVGNPTTSVDLLLAVLRHPDLLQDGVVDRMVLMQPAFGTRLLTGAARVLPIGAIGKNDPVRVHKLFRRALDDFPRALRPLLDRAVGYLRASAKGADLNPLLVPSAWAIGGDNDGVSRIEEQRLPGVGHDLVVRYDVDHWDATARRALSSLSEPALEALARDILRAVAR
jgi:hypothetical protein